MELFNTTIVSESIEIVEELKKARKKKFKKSVEKTHTPSRNTIRVEIKQSVGSFTKVGQIFVEVGQILV